MRFVPVRLLGVSALVVLAAAVAVRAQDPGAKASTTDPRASLKAGFHDAGMMVRITADTIALSPPLMINENQIDEIFSDKMPKILASVA